MVVRAVPLARSQAVEYLETHRAADDELVARVTASGRRVDDPLGTPDEALVLPEVAAESG
jgi:hypothetical protein